VRFASVYRSFRDVHEFMRELEDLIAERRVTPRPRSGRGAKPASTAGGRASTPPRRRA
jgi:hypothetical protein